MRVLLLIAGLSLLCLSHSSLEHSRRQACPPTTCADPQYSSESPCGDCEGSQCMLRGCVHSGAFFMTWRPNPCTTCFCQDGTELCAVVDCAPVECYGYPVVTRPGRCCPECDFNVSATECAAVPVGILTQEVPIGDTSCQQTVFEQSCDKTFVVDDNGTWFMCDPIPGEVTELVANLPESPCGSQVSHVTYQTVARCNKRQLDSSEIPQDYDIDPYSCYYVDGPVSSNPTASGITSIPTASGIPTASATPIAPPTATPLLLSCAMVLCSLF